MLPARCQLSSWQRAVGSAMRRRTAAAAACRHQAGGTAASVQQQPLCSQQQQQQQQAGNDGLQPARPAAAARPARRRRQGRRLRAGSSDPQASSGNGSSIGGGGGSNGSSGGSGGGNGGGGSSPPPGDASGSDGRISLSRQALMPVVLAAAAGTGALVVLLVNLFWTQLQLVNATNALTEGAEEHRVNSAAIRDRIAALKRLLREVFADQLAFKQRLDVLEKAGASAPEAADDYHLQALTRSASSSSWPRAPMRACGVFSAAAVLPWSQEASREDALAVLSALGASGQADGRLLLHSVLSGGKRRLTAELRQAMTAECGPVLQLQRLLYRVQASDWLQLMIAPLGGGLDALGRAVTPMRGDFGCTQALLQGHQLSALDARGSGKALCITHGCFSAAGGLFIGAGRCAVAHLQLQGRQGHSLSLVAASTRPGSRHAAGDGDGSGMRFLGAQAPQRHVRPAGDGGDPPAVGSSTVGLAGAVPLGDALTVTAWAERPRGGRHGWGVGVYSQADDDGLELGMVLGQPSSASHAAFRETQAAAPLFCELSAKLPLGQGLHVSPGALLSVRGGAASLAYVMQSSWRF